MLTEAEEFRQAMVELRTWAKLHDADLDVWRALTSVAKYAPKEPMPDGEGRGTWSVVLFDSEDEFELVLDIGTEEDMRRLAAEYPKGEYRAEVALVHRTVKR